MGRSGLGRNKVYSTMMLRASGRVVLQTVADIGFMFHLFILGVHVDATMVKNAERNAVLIGVSCFALPYALGGLAIITIPYLAVVDDSAQHALPYIAALNSVSTFPVITSLLGDLKLLNSEVGRIATLASLVSDCCSYFISVLVATINASASYTRWTGVLSVTWTATFLILIVFAVRPLVLIIERHIPEGRPMREGQFLVLVVMVLLCGFLSESLGQPAGLGTFILGIVVPEGPPLGSAMVYKIDSFCTGLLLPAKFAISGSTMDIFSIGNGKSVVVLESVIILGYVGKFAGTLVPAVHYGIPLRDAVSLALIMCCKGIIEAALYISLRDNGIITNEAYALLLITMLVTTGIARPLIWYLYDPSKRYLGYRTNSILHLGPDSELRMQVCIHNEDNVFSIVNLLEASNPMRKTPISVFVLNLMDLKGRAAPLLVATHDQRGKPKLKSLPSRTEHISNAFNIFAQRNQSCVAVQHFTSIAPYATMHEDICTIAVDKGVNIVIIPFHKQWAIDGKVGANFPAIRMVNKNVLQKAPCTVGVLVDRGQIADNQAILLGHSMFRVTMLYLGGPDDREALAYCSRMAEHPHIRLTLLWLRHSSDKRVSEDVENCFGANVINRFKATNVEGERVSYKEEVVKDAVGTTRVLRSLEESCDLCVVGRHHDPNSELTLGITEWIEFPELGFIGDMLATSDYRFSLLIVQQIPQGTELENIHSLKPISSSFGSVCGAMKYHHQSSFSSVSEDIVYRN